jgi:hypothetical protein
VVRHVPDAANGVSEPTTDEVIAVSVNNVARFCKLIGHTMFTIIKAQCGANYYCLRICSRTNGNTFSTGAKLENGERGFILWCETGQVRHV